MTLPVSTLCWRALVSSTRLSSQGFGPYGADRLMQHRLLRAPPPRQPGKGPERGGVFQMEGQFLITQLAVLLKQRAAQHCFRRQARATGFLDPTPAQVLRYKVQQVPSIAISQTNSEACRLWTRTSLGSRLSPQGHWYGTFDRRFNTTEQIPAGMQTGGRRNIHNGAGASPFSWEKCKRQRSRRSPGWAYASCPSGCRFVPGVDARLRAAATRIVDDDVKTAKIAGNLKPVGGRSHVRYQNCRRRLMQPCH